MPTMIPRMIGNSSSLKPRVADMLQQSRVSEPGNPCSTRKVSLSFAGGAFPAGAANVLLPLRFARFSPPASAAICPLWDRRVEGLGRLFPIAIPRWHWATVRPRAGLERISLAEADNLETKAPGILQRDRTR